MLQICPPHLSDVATLHWEIQKSHFQQYYSYISYFSGRLQGSLCLSYVVRLWYMVPLSTTHQGLRGISHPQSAKPMVAENTTHWALQKSWNNSGWIGAPPKNNCVGWGQLRWLGHVIRMPDNRLPRRLLYVELIVGQCSVGRPKKRFIDHIKANLLKCNIKPSDLEALASNRVYMENCLWYWS